MGVHKVRTKTKVGGRVGIIAKQPENGVTGKGFNIFEAALLLRMLAQQCDLEPGEIVWMGADCHLYVNHEHLVTKQLTRDPRPFPPLDLLRRPDDIFSYRFDDFAVTGYDPHPHIAAPVAV